MILKLKNIRKTYTREGFLGKRLSSVEALRGVSFCLEKGEILALVGESGSGKSTLAKIICGLEKPTSGELIWDDSKNKYPAQMVFQNPLYSLNPKLSIRYAINEALSCGNVPKELRSERFQVLLEGSGLKNIDPDKYPHQFSGGQRQRIAIARALALNPEVLVCDEPVSALDISVQAQIINFIKSISDSTGLPVIFIAHDLEAVSMIASRIIVMRDGGIEEEGSVEKIFFSPESDYTRQLLSAVPVNPWKQIRNSE